VATLKHGRMEERVNGRDTVLARGIYTIHAASELFKGVLRQFSAVNRCSRIAPKPGRPWRRQEQAREAITRAGTP